MRIIRTCREMGIETVAVYSAADKDSLHTLLADRKVCIGPPSSAQSYLFPSSIIMAAIHTKCDAVHPGVGFLSENPAFARLVRESGLLFIGPDPEVIALLGDKVQARKTAGRFGLPVTPGTENPVSNLDEARHAARTLGFPIIIKAAAGGGGKGMRVARAESDLEENFRVARAESEANFGDPRVFIETYLENPRHVELQILASSLGTKAGEVAVLGERDCSVQKNHQKLIEESPSPGVSPEMREAMQTGAIPMFRDLGYSGAGTIEFLVSGDQFYFMEVNARVQVEHPVSEFITGVDIIREQILACTEGRLEMDPGAVNPSGWAIECRINALTPGRVSELRVPGGPGVRFDSFLYTGCTVPPHYDALVGKLIVYARDRPAGLGKMERALQELRIEGIKTNILQQLWIIREPRFRSGLFGTAYYETIAKEAENA